MKYARNLAVAPVKKAPKARASRPARESDADLERLVGLADSGRTGVNLADLSREEIRARLFGS